MEAFGEPQNDDASIIQVHEMGTLKGFGKLGVCMMPCFSVRKPPHGAAGDGYLERTSVVGDAEATFMVFLHLAKMTASMK